MFNYCLMILNLVFFSGNKDIKSIADDYLKTQLKNYTRWQSEVASYPQIINTGDLELKIDNDKEFKLNKGFGYIPVKLIDAKGKSTLSIITVKLKLYQNVFIVSRPIKMNEEISPADFTIEEREVSLLSDKPIDTALDAVGLRTTMPIKAGSILQFRMIENIPLIKRGTRVDAYVRQGAIIITLSVETREDGRLGETIRVVSNDKKIFKAIVESKNSVKIVE